MPIARFQMQDGRVARFEVPDGTTPEQAQSMMSDYMSSAGAQPLTRIEKIGKGLRDPVDGGAQLLTKVLPDGIVNAGNRFNNWLADKTGLVGRLPEGGVDQQVRETEAEYQARRAAGGESGFDGYRMLGNVANPANLAAAARLPQLATMGGRIALGSGFGGASAAFSPVGEGDFWNEKGKQVATGAIAGGVTPAVVGGAARIISPNASRNPNLALLKDEGVRPTVGQTLGGRWNSLEEKLQSIPMLGDAISNARARSLTDFNKAAINRASGKVGATVDDVGQEGARKAGDAIGSAYDDALSQIKGVRFDGQFNRDIVQLRGMAQSLVPAMRDKFNKTYTDIVAGRMSRNGAMLPETFKNVDSELGKLASKYSKSSVASEQELGDAVLQLQNLVKQQMIRSNPKVAEKLAAADEGWANLVRIEGAAKAGKNAEGVFTPGQLNQAIQTADDSVRKRAVSRGTALMQDLGNAGQQVLGNRVPNSFTTDRALIATGALGGSYLLDPMLAGGLMTGAAAYSAPVQRLLSAAASARPQAAEPIAKALNQNASRFLPLTTQFGLGLLD